MKPNKSISGHSSINTDRGRLTATNVSLRRLIVRAYGLQDYQVEAPDWLSSERFDVAATFPEALPKEREKRDPAFRSMLQNMLADRFKLVVHREQKIRPVYGLVAAKNGIKFKEATGCTPYSQNSSDTHYEGACVSMDLFAGFLATRRRDLPSDLPVLDVTGLKGLYNVTLNWVPDSGQSNADSGKLPAAVDTPSGVTLLVALDEQLGLRLETRKAPVDILLVDSAQREPSAN